MVDERRRRTVAAATTTARGGRTTWRASQYAGKAADAIRTAFMAFASAYPVGTLSGIQTGACTSGASGAGKKKGCSRSASPSPAAMLCASFE